MKKVFIIHSHTVFLTSLGVIDKLHLKKDDILFIYGRNYKQGIFNLSYSIYDMSDIYEESKNMLLSVSRKNLINYDKISHITSFIDNYINTNIGDVFEVYLPHLSSPFFQLFATSPYCVKCHFLQEGGRIMVKSLYGEDPFIIKLYNYAFLRKNKRIWRTNKWLITGYQKYVNYSVDAYAIESDFFGGLNVKVCIISWPKTNNLPISINNKWPIFVFDGFVEQGAIGREDYIKAINKMVNEDAKEMNYLKFHPNQKEDNIKSIVMLFKSKGYEISILNNSIPFELVLSSFQNLKVYGFGSSLLFFARSLGHIVKSHERELFSSKQYCRFFKRNIGPVERSLILD